MYVPAPLMAEEADQTTAWLALGVAAISLIFTVWSHVQADKKTEKRIRKTLQVLNPMHDVMHAFGTYLSRYRSVMRKHSSREAKKDAIGQLVMADDEVAQSIDCLCMKWRSCPVSMEDWDEVLRHQPRYAENTAITPPDNASRYVVDMKRSLAALRDRLEASDP